MRRLLDGGLLDLPLPGHGNTPRRWTELADLGRDDLVVARLAEGHTDAVAILAEAGRAPAAHALYGVWAARPGGRGASLQAAARSTQTGSTQTGSSQAGSTQTGSTLLSGTVRFCSGARVVDRALVIADDAGGAGRLLVDVAIDPASARADPGSWNAAAMAAADTLDVCFDGVPVRSEDVVGGPDWYVDRPGFAAGGGGVAAVWWGGAAGLVARAVSHLSATPDAHQLAHLGELDALLQAADALLSRVASAIDEQPLGDHGLGVARARCAVERVVREVVDRVPRMLGPGPLSTDGELAATLADLGMYVRQHHGERDHAALGASVLRERAAR